MEIMPIKYTVSGAYNIAQVVHEMQQMADKAKVNVYTYFNGFFILAKPGGSSSGLYSDFRTRASAKHAQWKRVRK